MRAAPTDLDSSPAWNPRVVAAAGDPTAGGRLRPPARTGGRTRLVDHERVSGVVVPDGVAADHGGTNDALAGQWDASGG